MNIIEFKTGDTNPTQSDEDLLKSLRLHDQMLSCLTFVLEKSTELHPEDSDFEPLYSSIELIGEKRARVVEALGASRQKRSASFD